jgi:hypothetical protein
MAFPAGRPIARFRQDFPAVTTIKAVKAVMAVMAVVALAVTVARAPAVASPSGAAVPARAGAHTTRNGRPGTTGRSSKPVDDQVAGKVAFFHFRGQDLADFEAPVAKALRDHGLTVLTELRPVDLPDQFRDLAATLDLIAYVDGTVTPMRGGDRIRVALAVRSGYSGRKVATLSVIATPEDFPSKLDELFWKRFGPALVRARADAQKPRRRTHAPMQIDASSPVDSVPARKAAQAATTAKGPS